MRIAGRYVITLSCSNRNPNDNDPFQAANVDPRRSQRTKKMLEITARDAFAHFFPQAADTGSYTLGHHVDIFLLVLERTFADSKNI